jgi:hypothetical protein
MKQEKQTMLNKSHEAIEQEIVQRATHDADFRQALLDDPKTAVADLLNVTLPPGMEITVLEQRPGQHILVLPPLVPTPEALPLDDLELALVGGGRTLRPHLIGVTRGCSNVRTNQTVVKSSC